MTEPPDDSSAQRAHDSDLTASAETRTADAHTTKYDAADTAFESGRDVGHYRLVRLLGRGGFGSVWEAEHRDTGRRLALKVLTAHRGASPVAFERFSQEGRLAATLNHPRCVFVFGAEQVAGYPAVAMELMPGGTLQDAIKARGALPWREATDRILDVLEGLDAAHRAGIVHRDIKPSNCFVDIDGRAKIGDFGISKTLDPAGALTMSGDFVGTPFYASPEQVRGHDVDFRSDIYSAGATLYALLTGKAPFRGGGAGEVLARVLTEPPPSFAEAGVTTPRGLERVVRRMMAKDPAKRYRDYGSLRVALLPYSSNGLDVASLGLRFVAYQFDLLVWLPLTFWLTRSMLLSGVDISARSQIISLVLSPTLYYFTLTEWRWGRTLGKYLLGLRVTTDNGGPPSLLQTFGRISALASLPVLPYLLVFLFNVKITLWFSSSATVLMLVPLVTMRRRNGFAGLHELLTRTRVTTARRTDDVEVPESAVIDTPDPLAPSLVGPYRRHRRVWSAPAGEFLVAVDDVLRRNVWIHRFTDPSHTTLPSVLAQTRPHRLRWLAGTRNPGDSWDAYEAPLGIALTDWVTTRGHLTWKEMRPILHTLADELAARETDGTSDRSLLPEHVWIDRMGNAKLLDFPLSSTGDVREHVSPSRFLQQIATFGLSGTRLTEHELDGARPEEPVPGHAEDILEGLAAPMSPADLSERLRAIAHRPARVTRGRRAGPLLALPGVLFLLCAMPAFGAFISLSVIRATPIGQLLDSSMALDRRDIGPPNTRVTDEEILAHERIVAGLYARLKNSPTMPGFPARSRDRYEALMARYPTVSDAELKAALAFVAAHKHPEDSGELSVIRDMMGMLMRVAAYAALVMIIFSTLLRAPMLRMAGLVLRTSDGWQVTRGRYLTRAVVAAAPVLLFLHWGLPKPDVSIWLLAASWTALLIGVIFAIVKPSRGIPDLIAGTVLVPR